MTTAANTTDSNGKVTLALIGQKLDRLILDLEDFKRELKTQDECIDSLERVTERHDVKIANMETRVNTWSSVNSLAAIVAGALAAIGINK